MENKKKNWCYMGIAALVIALLLALDQWTKHLAVVCLKGQPGYVLIDGVLELDYLENRGAAFGVLQNQQWLFAVLTVAFLIFAWIVFWKIPKTPHFLPIFWLLVVLTAGAIGNFIDRITQKYVVDFLYFKLIDFPIFNVADCYVTVGAILLAILILFVYKDEELGFLSLKKKV